MTLRTHRVVTVQGAQLPKSEYGTDFMLVRSLSGRECLNELSEYQLTLRTRDDNQRSAVAVQANMSTANVKRSGRNQDGNPVGGFAGMDGYISKATAQAGGSPGSNWDLSKVIGSTVTVGIECDGKIDAAEFADNAFGRDITRAAGSILLSAKGQTTRHISGIVTQVASSGTEGRSALYTLVLRPWYWLLTQSSDYKVYQKQSPIDIINDIVHRLPYPVEWRITGSYPILDFQIQYGQTHWDYLTSLCQEYGINYWTEHQEDGHTLVFSDHLAGYKPMDSVAYQSLYVYPKDLKLQEEYLHTFNPTQTLTTGQVQLSDYQFKQPKADQSATAHNPWETAHNDLEVYEWQQGDYLEAQDGGSDKAQLRMQEFRQHGQRMSGAGNLRGLQTGHTFTLHNHPMEDANQGWILLGQELHLTNIAPETAGNGVAQYLIDTRIRVQPDTEQVRPERTNQKPTASMQTATVVGPADKEIWTDQYGRVKIQFHWDRYGTKDENSTCWVRVSTPWAGTNFGGVHLPRIGQEVIVDFLNADPDMPIIVGRLNNPNTMPSWELPTQQALSGFKSKELYGAQNNHLIMDDTTEQVQVQLSSDHQLSQLNLGYVTRIPDTKGRKDYRGQGFELRTDGWGVIRSAQGMVLTTYAKSNAAGHIKDIGETTGLLKSAHSQHQSFAQLAIDHKADERSINDNAQAQLKTQNEEITGVIAGSTRNPQASSADKFPELSAPHLVISSPAGIAIATPKSTHIASNEHIALTSGKDVSLSVGQRLAASVSKGISLFTQSLGIKMFAAKGKVEIQAQTDNIEIIADQVLKIISAKKSIEIAAKDEILLTAKGSYIKINGAGIEHGTPAAWKVHAASHGLPGAKSLPMRLPDLKSKPYVELNYHWPDDLEPVQFAPYIVRFSGGKTMKGKLDKNGYARIDDAPDEEWEVWFGEDGRPEPEVPPIKLQSVKFNEGGA